MAAGSQAPHVAGVGPTTRAAILLSTATAALIGLVVPLDRSTPLAAGGSPTSRSVGRRSSASSSATARCRTALAAGGFVALMVGVTRWAASARLVLALSGALVVVAAHLETGHSTIVEPAAVALTANFAHLMAAAVWVGGLALLPVVLHKRASSPGTATVARF